MLAMLHVLTHDILPVFAMMALGFLLGRAKVISGADASVLNRVAFLTLQPALLFPLINKLDWHAFQFDAIGLYAACQVIVFSLTYVVCRYALRRERLEAWLLAMATIFVNTLLYIWPISYLIYGEVAALPITAIVAWDATVTFAFFIITTDLMANPDAGIRQSLRRMTRNPVLIAIAFGVVTNLAGLAAPAPILTGLDFAGAAAAPLTLFALGVILSGHPLTPNATVMVVSGLKLLAFPALVYAALHLGDRPAQWNTLIVLCAAGPAGAMSFALAMLHGVRTDVIAPVIIWTSTLSLISLAWLA